MALILIADDKAPDSPSGIRFFAPRWTYHIRGRRWRTGIGTD